MTKHKYYAIIAALLSLIAAVYGLNCITTANYIGYWIALFTTILFGLMSVHHIQSYFDKAHYP